jgi:hypothetical protein
MSSGCFQKLLKKVGVQSLSLGCSQKSPISSIMWNVMGAVVAKQLLLFHRVNVVYINIHNILSKSSENYIH